VRQFLLRRYILHLPQERQSTWLLFLDYLLFVATGVGIGAYHNLAWNFPAVSGLELTIGFATFGLFAALDLSLDWEYRIIKQGGTFARPRPKRDSYVPQTRRFAFLASGVIVFVTIVLLLLLARDIAWLKEQEVAGLALSELLRSVITEVLFVMGILLGLTMVLVFSYARNLKYLFNNQTCVLELVSQGRLDTKVPVVTNDEFAVIAGHTNDMIDRLVERDQMAHGLELARQIQRSLLPAASPFVPGIQVYAASLFCEQTGGDFYDYMVRDRAEGTELLLIIGDVTGHGVGSALLMASVRAYLKASLLQDGDLADAMNRTNSLVCRDVAGSGHFVTLFLLAVNPTACTATWVGAGHDPAFFLPRGESTPIRMEGHDIPLGVDRKWRYSMRSGPLGRGIVLLGTDGIWEAVDGDVEMFGKQRMLDVLRQNAGASPQEIAERILSAVDDFTGSVRLEDDRTLVVARLT